jgi:hypothetical protein
LIFPLVVAPHPVARRRRLIFVLFPADFASFAAACLRKKQRNQICRNLRTSRLPIKTSEHMVDLVIGFTVMKRGLICPWPNQRM